jgi:hypothetical protein
MATAPATKLTAQERYNEWKAEHPGLPVTLYDMVAHMFSFLFHGTVTP